MKQLLLYTLTLGILALTTTSTTADSHLEELKPSGRFFTDSHGRVRILRGINLAANSKVPSLPEYAPSHKLDGFIDNRYRVQFINHPFPLSEADEHYTRLRQWGFDTLRFIVTWEAIEHSGPGIYDDEYIQYVIDVLKAARKYNMRVFIDPHQDVWSRFSGGDGAPAWTLEYAGFNVANLHETGAAMLNSHMEDYPKHGWPANYLKLASATMFTLFYGGDTFAPKTRVQDPVRKETVSIQDFLQTRYMDAVAYLAKRIYEEDLGDVVLGYDTMNEPHSGFIGYKHLDKYLGAFGDARVGPTPTPFQAMRLANGESLVVWTFHTGILGARRNGWQRVNKDKKRAWVGECVWKQNGVWDGQKLVKPDYFTKNPTTNEKVEFYQEFWKPFALKFTRRLRKAHPDTMIFLEPGPTEIPPDTRDEADLQKNVVYAPHWYDVATITMKRWIPWLNVDSIGFKYGIYKFILQALRVGKGKVRQAFVDQMKMIREKGVEKLGEHSMLVGETGMSMDLNKGVEKKDYSQTIDMLDTVLSAMEQNMVSYTLWTYNPLNNNKEGDGWNGEDFSIYSQEDKGRCLESVVRPHPKAISGTPVYSYFDMKTKTYKLKAVQSSKEPTEIFIPQWQYPNISNLKVDAKGAKWELFSEKLPSKEEIHFVRVWPEESEYTIEIS